MLGADSVAAGFPRLAALFLPGEAAQASVAAADAAPELREPLARLAPGEDRPAIAIVIDDLGGDVAHTRRAIALPQEVALAFLPYPRDTPSLARAARRAGHELLVHVPMQAVGEAKPEPMALTVGLPRGEILRRLDWDLVRVPGFAGINNHEGSRFTADRNALAPVMDRLAQRGVFFLDSRTTPDTQVGPAARAAGVETAGRDVFLDNVATVDAVDAQLRVLEAKARAQGSAIAIGHPHDVTLDAVAYWAARRDGFDLVTLSEAMRRKRPLRAALVR